MSGVICRQNWDAPLCVHTGAESRRGATHEETGKSPHPYRWSPWGLTYLSALWLLPPCSPSPCLVGSFGSSSSIVHLLIKSAPSRASPFKLPSEAVLEKLILNQCESTAKVYWVPSSQIQPQPTIHSHVQFVSTMPRNLDHFDNIVVLWHLWEICPRMIMSFSTYR